MVMVCQQVLSGRYICNNPVAIVDMQGVAIRLNVVHDILMGGSGCGISKKGGELELES